MAIILQIGLSAFVLLMVGMLLLGINHYLRCDDSLSPSETDELKKELEDTPRVITRRSVFHNFLARKI